MNERSVDASLIVKLALEDEAHSAAARHLVRQSVADGIRLIAPPIFTAEIDSVIRRCVCTGRLSQVWPEQQSNAPRWSSMNRRCARGRILQC